MADSGNIPTDAACNRTCSKSDTDDDSDSDTSHSINYYRNDSNSDSYSLYLNRESSSGTRAAPIYNQLRTVQWTEKKVNQNIIDSDESDGENIHSNINHNEERYRDNYSSDGKNADNEEEDDVIENYDINDEAVSEDDIVETVRLESFLINLLGRLIFLLWDIIMGSFRRSAE